MGGGESLEENIEKRRLTSCHNACQVCDRHDEALKHERHEDRAGEHCHRSRKWYLNRRQKVSGNEDDRCAERVEASQPDQVLDDLSEKARQFFNRIGRCAMLNPSMTQILNNWSASS